MFSVSWRRIFARLLRTVELYILYGLHTAPRVENGLPKGEGVVGSDFKDKNQKLSGVGKYSFKLTHYSRTLFFNIYPIIFKRKSPIIPKKKADKNADET